MQGTSGATFSLSQQHVIPGSLPSCRQFGREEQQHQLPGALQQVAVPPEAEALCRDGSWYPCTRNHLSQGCPERASPGRVCPRDGALQPDGRCTPAVPSWGSVLPASPAGRRQRAVCTSRLCMSTPCVATARAPGVFRALAGSLGGLDVGV